MRLAILDHGHRPLQKLQLAIMRWISGIHPGPTALLSYRSEYFGEKMLACTKECMRQATAWNVWEVELFAAFIADRQRCRF